MEEQYKKTFDQMVDSLKMYQRYELKDKNRKDILDKVYVDPIENDGILNLCLKDNTTVLIGRRGTGKSTIFMRMQNELRKQNDMRYVLPLLMDTMSIFGITVLRITYFFQQLCGGYLACGLYALLLYFHHC